MAAHEVARAARLAVDSWGSGLPSSSPPPQPWKGPSSNSAAAKRMELQRDLQGLYSPERNENEESLGTTDTSAPTSRKKGAKTPNEPAMTTASLQLQLRSGGREKRGPKTPADMPLALGTGLGGSGPTSIMLGMGSGGIVTAVRSGGSDEGDAGDRGTGSPSRVWTPFLQSGNHPSHGFEETEGYMSEQEVMDDDSDALGLSPSRSASAPGGVHPTGKYHGGLGSTGGSSGGRMVLGAGGASTLPPMESSHTMRRSLQSRQSLSSAGGLSIGGSRQASRGAALPGAISGHMPSRGGTGMGLTMGFDPPRGVGVGGARIGVASRGAPPSRQSLQSRSSVGMGGLGPSSRGTVGLGGVGGFMDVGSVLSDEDGDGDDGSPSLANPSHHTHQSSPLRSGSGGALVGSTHSGAVHASGGKLSLSALASPGLGPAAGNGHSHSGMRNRDSEDTLDYTQYSNPEALYADPSADMMQAAMLSQSAGPMTSTASSSHSPYFGDGAAMSRSHDRLQRRTGIRGGGKNEYVYWLKDPGAPANVNPPVLPHVHMQNGHAVAAVEHNEFIDRDPNAIAQASRQGGYGRDSRQHHQYAGRSTRAHIGHQRGLTLSHGGPYDLARGHGAHHLAHVVGPGAPLHAGLTGMSRIRLMSVPKHKRPAKGAGFRSMQGKSSGATSPSKSKARFVASEAARTPEAAFNADLWAHKFSLTPLVTDEAFSGGKQGRRDTMLQLIKGWQMYRGDFDGSNVEWEAYQHDSTQIGAIPLQKVGDSTGAISNISGPNHGQSSGSPTKARRLSGTSRSPTKRPSTKVMKRSAQMRGQYDSTVAAAIASTSLAASGRIGTKGR